MIKFEDSDHVSNNYALENPLVEVTGYKNADFMYFADLFTTIHSEIIGISHVSLKTARLLRGAGYLRPSDFGTRVKSMGAARSMFDSLKRQTSDVCSFSFKFLFF